MDPNSHYRAGEFNNIAETKPESGASYGQQKDWNAGPVVTI
jgi:hypothetical protein